VEYCHLLMMFGRRKVKDSLMMLGPCQFPCCKDLLVMILLLWDLKVARKNKNISNVYSDILFHVRIMVNSLFGFKPFLLMDGWLVLRILLMMFYYYLYAQEK
jgi:hypothetical protein